jgi:hypothetical protein
MLNDTDEPKITLTRDEILKTETPPKVYVLPSGQSVSVKYLAFFLVREIYKSCESTTEGDFERMFTEKVIKWMLRENDHKDFSSFCEEDQQRLIEIAVEEWGCEVEYHSLSAIENPEIRFYQAVNNQEKELARQLSESLRTMTASLANVMFPLTTIQGDLASSLKGLLDQFSVSFHVSDVFNKLNLRVIDKIRDISALTPPIIGIAGEIAAIQDSMFLPFEKILLENVSGTLSIYQNLMRNTLPIARFSVLPDSVRYYPTIEMHNTSIVTGRLMKEDFNKQDYEIITPNDDELLAWLGSLDPSFPKMIKGAQQTIFSRNPDHCRHFASSHRELSTLILHLLAPNDQVKNWTKDPNHFDKDGKPTRKARLKYIARNHHNKTFVDFLIKDFENQMALLNADEHRNSQEYTDQELNTLHMRFLSMLGFFMQIISSHS